MARALELKRIRERLLRRYAQLRKSLAAGLFDLGDQSRQTMTDNVDIATETLSDDMASKLVERDSRELEEIRESLDRMKEGRYDRCEMCGHKIPMTRLNALPFTSTCVDCQREQERLGGSVSGEDVPEAWQGVFDHESRMKDEWSDFTLDLSAESPT
jgi:RNA polymerase-binding transcription factor